MGHKFFQKILQQKFVPSDKEAWRKTAISETDGNEPFNKLKWNIDDDIYIEPYYDRTGVTEIETRFKLPPSRDTFFGNRKWYNQPLVAVTDEVTANKISLEHLSTGADGILFDLQALPECKFEILLQNIRWEYCRLSFKGISSNKFFDGIQSFLKEQNDLTAAYTGSVYFNPDSQSAFIKRVPLIKNFESFGFWIERSTPVREIHEALYRMVDVIERFQKEMNVKEIIRSISFSLPAETHFLTDIAKLRALRMLWYQIVRCYEVTDCGFDELHIHARSSVYANEKFQPHGNMIKGTFSAMAAISGGANSLSILSGNSDNATMNRIARNVSSILKEESHFDKVSDPFAGSYVIEKMTHEIAGKSWKMFQTTNSK